MPTLTTQMKSVGETMAIGRTFKESFQKALRGLEVGSFGFGCDSKDLWGTPQQPGREDIRAAIATPGADRVWFLRYALLDGMSSEEIHRLTYIDPWFLRQLARDRGAGKNGSASSRACWASAPTCSGEAKRNGFSDRQLSWMWGTTELNVRIERKRRGIVATFKSVDTCAAEFEAYTPYYYSTYEDDDETPVKAARHPAGDDPRRRTQPHRPGHRVRLLLLPC